MKMTPRFARLVSGFFTGKLVGEKGASVNTVATYRDGMRLFLQHLEETQEGCLDVASFNDTSVTSFLNAYEGGGNRGARSRNLRLAMLRSFAKYVRFVYPDLSDSMNRILEIGMKKCTHKVVQWLDCHEADAFLDASRRYLGGRYNALAMFMYQTGARVSEVTDLKVSQLRLDGMRSVTIHGKGNKERIVPLEKPVVEALRRMLTERNASGGDPVFVSGQGGKYTRRAIAYAIERLVAEAAKTCPSLKGKTISPHSIRHSTAMHLLQKGADINTVRLVLGHVSVETTNVYVETDTELKRMALKKANLNLAAFKPKKKRTGEDVYAFLESIQRQAEGQRVPTRP